MEDSENLNPSADAPSSLALKLSESTQRKARSNFQPVIAAILDKALKGSARNIHVKTLLSPDLFKTVSTLIARAQCLDLDYKPTDFEAWYEIQIPAHQNEDAKLRDQQQQQCDIADELVRRLNGPGFPEVENAHILRLTSPSTSLPNAFQACGAEGRRPSTPFSSSHALPQGRRQRRRGPESPLHDAALDPGSASHVCL